MKFNDIDDHEPIGLSDAQLDALLAEPLIPYDPISVAAALDAKAAREDVAESVDLMAAFWEDYGATMDAWHDDEVAATGPHADCDRCGTLVLPAHLDGRDISDEGEVTPGDWLPEVEEPDEAEVTGDWAWERELQSRYPAWHQWPQREHERAVRAGLIPDEPMDDDCDWPDDLASD